MTTNILIYILRRDLRLQDNPIFSALSSATKSGHSFTHLLPVYIVSAQQVEVSGFINNNSPSPYPEARSRVGGFWRCGPHRAKFLAESVWELKDSLTSHGSCLEIRVGTTGDVVKSLVDGLKASKSNIGAVWMTGEECTEEKSEERDVRNICQSEGIDFKLWKDEKYFIDDRDLPLDKAEDLPNVFTTYRKMVEPLREAPRPTLPHIEKNSLPPPPAPEKIPKQQEPFNIPTDYKDFEKALLSPLSDLGIPNPPTYPPNTESAHPFSGGASKARERLEHLLTSGSATSYKDTRNGLLGTDYSTKLSAWLALGCITAREIHEALYAFEEGDNAPDGPWKGIGKDATGYGQGESDGTKAIRFELLWRDYMRLCTAKFKHRLFRPEGFRDLEQSWKLPRSAIASKKNGGDDVTSVIYRFLNGTTGMGLIDASQRELFLTGYMSNRSRQNVASFLARHLGIDWRIGAEWFECLLTDYDVSSNWGNWQYVAGVGNDPRDREGAGRVFNPVKQSYDYDPKGDYIKAWIPELRNLSVADGNSETSSSTQAKDQDEANGSAQANGNGKGNVSNASRQQALEQAAVIFQPWTMEADKKAQLGLTNVEWVESPLRRIDFYLGKRKKSKARTKQDNGASHKHHEKGVTNGRGQGSKRHNNAADDASGKKMNHKYRHQGRKHGGSARGGGIAGTTAEGQGYSY